MQAQRDHMKLLVDNIVMYMRAVNHCDLPEVFMSIAVGTCELGVMYTGAARARPWGTAGYTRFSLPSATAESKRKRQDKLHLD